MADLPDGPLVRVNDIEVNQDKPVTEALLNKIGTDLNGLIALKEYVDALAGTVKLNYQEFNADGTFAAPANLKGGLAFLYGWGGGGGGGSGTRTIGFGAGGSGGDGAGRGWALYPVVAGNSYAVTIGIGGTAAASYGSGSDGSPGGAGTDTVFDGTLQFNAALGGSAGLSTATPVRRSDTASLSFSQPQGQGTFGGLGGGVYAGSFTVGAGKIGQIGIHYNGGAGGATASSLSGGGGGGAGPGGAGAAGGTGGNSASSAAAANTGGGGGGGGAGAATGHGGSNGGSGKLFVIWLESDL